MRAASERVARFARGRLEAHLDALERFALVKLDPPSAQELADRETCRLWNSGRGIRLEEAKEEFLRRIDMIAERRDAAKELFPSD